MSVKVLHTPNGYGVVHIEDLSFLIEDIPYNQALAYARDYNKLEEARKVAKRPATYSKHDQVAKGNIKTVRREDNR